MEETKDVKSWSVDSVCQWLNSVGLGRYQDEFGN